MARVIVKEPKKVTVRIAGYTGTPTGEIELTENNRTYNVSSYATATTNIPEPSGTKDIVENGNYNVKDFEFADVKVPLPTGETILTENNKSYDVTQYESAKVQIPEEEKTVTPSTVKQTVTPDNGLLKKVTVDPTPLEGGFVIPTTGEQRIRPSSPAIGFSSVRILPAPLESKTVTPSIEQQTIVPQSPAIGFSQVIIEPVTPSIDPDIQPENIKQGVDILGVQGALKPTMLIEKTITENGTYTAEDDNADGYSEVTVAVPREITKLVDGTITEYIDDEVTAIAPYTFYGRTALTTCIAPNVRTIGDHALDSCVSLSNVDFLNVRSINQYAFRAAKVYAVNFPNLLEVGARGFMNATGFSSWNLPLLETIDYYAFAFIAPANKVIDLPNCISIGEGAFYAVNLRNIILRKRATLANTNAFQTNVKIYAYQEDIDNYYSIATNWSALYARGQIYPIEGSEYE